VGLAAAAAVVTALGFACVWDRPPEPTWSHIPWHLRAALASRVPVVDLPAEPGRLAVSALWHAYRWTHRGPPDGWRTTRLNDALTASRVHRGVRRSRPDAVLQIGDLARVRTPYYVYQDMNRLLLREWLARIGPRHLGYGDVAAELAPRRVEAQRERLAHAAGVFTMSAWQAAPLAGVVPAERVHVVGAGISSRRVAPAAARNGRRLLYVGGDFPRKGGDVAVAALALLRRDLGPVTLTVIGPPSWPGEVPAGVDFRGRQTPDQVGAAFAEHDVFVLPTRFEAFGIAFVEALAAGLPCVGPNAFAVPEIVGDSGVLVDDWTPEAYASAIATVLDSPAIRDRARDAADGVTQRFSWDAVAGRMLAAMGERT
jgi:glycosyltransferase involved in cell wall biosynthesis